MKGNFCFGYTAAVLVIVCLALAPQARAGGSGPPIPMTFSAIGSAPPSSSCNNGTNGCNGSNCNCLTIDGKGKGTLIGKSTFTSQTIVELQIVGASLCEPAAGTMTITTANIKNTLAIAYDGWDCLTDADLIGFNGPYTVDGAHSTGKFLNAVGGGTMSVNEDSGGNFYGTLSGNIVLSK